MILADTSIWIDHLRSSDSTLAGLLNQGQVSTHPFVVVVIGEIALRHLKQKTQVLQDLHHLPQITIAREDEVLRFIEQHKLFGHGIGYIDTHLLASLAMTPGTLLWTRDKRLYAMAKRLSCHAALP